MVVQQLDVGLAVKRSRVKTPGLGYVTTLGKLFTPITYVPVAKQYNVVSA